MKTITRLASINRGPGTIAFLFLMIPSDLVDHHLMRVEGNLVG